MTATRPRGHVAAAPALAVVPTALLRATRPRQWLKNILVVGAPVAAGRILEPRVDLDAALAFVAMCLAASSTYLVNDIHDAVEDRGHPRKRDRPVASGALSRSMAVAAAIGLAGAALAVSSLAHRGLLLLVAGYLALTMAYTFRLRREPVIELVVVAAGFVLRGAAGGVAADIRISSWFLVVAGFGSLFLVSGKRYTEILDDREDRRASLAAYTPTFLRFVWTSAATVTILAYALWATQVYLVRDEGAWALVSLVPFLLGLLLYALHVDRGDAEAPEDALLDDRALLVLGLVWAILLAVGSGGIDFGF